MPGKLGELTIEFDKKGYPIVCFRLDGSKRMQTASLGGLLLEALLEYEKRGEEGDAPPREEYLFRMVSTHDAVCEDLGWEDDIT